MTASDPDQAPPSRYLSVSFATLGILTVQILCLLVLGREWSQECQGVWQTEYSAVCNSRYFADAYTFLHLGFGLLLGMLFIAMRPVWPAKDIVLLCVFCSCVWEVIENTPAVIALFVYDTGSHLTYSGDSLQNSLGDSAATAFGGASAFFLPRRVVVTGLLSIELGVSLAISDGYVIGLMRTVGVL